MKYKKRVPVEVAGYRNAYLPTFDTKKNWIGDKWWSVANDLYGDDDILPWNADEGSKIPPF